ncbi:hypothetical protein [Halobaculum gomorrense]|uniref:Uncharacterized protein n=1 Tax=Halobaculum gomorrense TaxID=43928 RepID=A0A1M5MMW0_9EURY|nr:hypothetical protein [Halobaculum gomorrense]SHG78382.1 hypothetical protein SAMN05443636_1063 [Halobaculum gomorrense]
MSQSAITLRERYQLYRDGYEFRDVPDDADLSRVDELWGGLAAALAGAAITAVPATIALLLTASFSDTVRMIVMTLAAGVVLFSDTAAAPAHAFADHIAGIPVRTDTLDEVDR